MREALMTMKFTEDSGIGGAIAYVSDDIVITDSHIKIIVEARRLWLEGIYQEDKLPWWNPSAHW